MQSPVLATIGISVCLFVRLSVTCCYCVKTTQAGIMLGSSFMWVVIFYMGYFTPSRPRILRSIVSQKPVLSVTQHCWWKEKQIFFHYYLRQVNRVNSGITVFVQRVSVCVLVHSGPVNQTSLKRLELRASNLARMLPETVQKWPLKNFPKGGICKNSLDGNMHSLERLLVILVLMNTTLLIS